MGAYTSRKQAPKYKNGGDIIGCYHPRIRLEDRSKPYINKQGGISYWSKIIKPEDYEEYKERIKTLPKNFKYIETPCQKCIGCRLNYSSQWAVRCMLEASYYKENYFVTLTLNEKHLWDIPPGDIIDKETGEITGEAQIPSIDKDELKTFIKAVRDKWRNKYDHNGIRYFACGEYGTESGRKHYHIIFFNLPLHDLKFYKMNESREPMYNSQELEKIWGKGNVIIGEVTYNSCAYVARYVTKKILSMWSKKEDYISQGIEPEFIKMSTHPGIGKKYFDEHKEELMRDEKIVMQKHDGTTIQVSNPNYFKKQIRKLVTPEEWEAIQEKQKAKSEKIERIKMQKTSLGKKEQLQLEERAKKDKMIMLKRNKIERGS